MNIAVRYYSRTGNTKVLAEAIAKGVGVPAFRRFRCKQN